MTPGTVRAELRGDGLHLFFSGGDQGRRHEIVLKADPADGGVLDERAVLRIRAFAAAIAAEGDPKKAQRDAERRIVDGEAGVYDLEEAQRVADVARGALAREMETRLKNARESLRRSVLKAHELLPYEEVESIVRNALAESVLSS